MHVLKLVDLAKNYIDDLPLAHVFSTKGMNSDSEIIVGFYDEDADKVVTVKINGENVSVEQPADSFKKQDTITPLDITSVNIDLAAALETALGFVRDNYSGRMVDKQISLLQTIDDQPTYNFTFVTKQFSVLNLRLNASSGEVVSHNEESIFSFKAN